jgi:hypothetical protein
VIDDRTTVQDFGLEAFKAAFKVHGWKWDE